MTWTNKLSTIEAIKTGYAYYYSGVSYWMEATSDYYVYSFTDGDPNKVKILDPVADISEITASSDMGYPALALIDGVLVFVSIVVGATDSLIAYKYNGTPNSWTRTLLVSSSDTPSSLNLSLCESKRLIVGWQSNFSSCTSCISEYRMTTDGINWTSISGPVMPNDDMDSRSGVGFFDDDHYMHVYDRVNLDYEIWKSTSGGSFSFLHDLAGDDISYVGYGIKSSGNGGADLFAIRNADNIVMRSGDGTTWTATSQTITGTPYDVQIAYAGGRAFLLNGGNIYYYKAGWQLIEASPDTVMYAAMNYNDKLWIHANDGAGSGDAWYEHSTFSDWVDLYPPSSANEKILSISTPILGGSDVWLTVWRDSILYLQKRLASTGGVTTEYALGSATESELNAKTYVAYVRAYTDDRILVFGRMDAPQGLSSPTHVMYSSDGGSSFSVVESGWGADNAGAMVITSSGRAWVIRNESGGYPSLYGGTVGGTLSKYSTLLFQASVNQGAFTIDDNGNLVAAADVGGSKMVLLCPPPYYTWADITSNYPSEAVNRVIAI